MDPQTKKAREIMSAIRKVLFFDWDPLGVSRTSSDETSYDQYINPVYQFLVRNPTEEKVVEFLSSLESGPSGDTEERLAQRRNTARKLVAIDVRMPPPWGRTAQVDGDEEEERTQDP